MAGIPKTIGVSTLGTPRCKEKMAVDKPKSASLRRNQLCGHLDLGLLPSSTVRKYSSVV